MKGGIIALLFISILLISPLVQAQTSSEYSGFNRFTDNLKMFFASGDNKVRLALEIREKEINSAIENSQNQDEEDAIKNLERAHKKLQLVQEKVSLDTADEVEESVDEIIGQIEGEENLSDNFDVYVLEEKKTQLIAGLTKEIFEMCKRLAKEDYTLMLQEEKCNQDTAPEWLQEELKELKRLQRRLFIKLMLDIRSCIDDPGTCNCEDVSDVNEKAQCEKMIALAVQCEYKNDQEACDKMIALRPPATSFIPDFLMNLFREKEGMIDDGIEHSDGVPEECGNENTKPECEQYRHLKETSAKCWDAEGNWDEEECGGPEGEVTMQESIPQCYDEVGIFLTEICGEITMIENEDGLINYIIGTEVDNVIDEFEDGYGNESLGQTEVWEIEEGIMDIEGDIQGWVVDHPAMEVDGDDGLTWQIKTNGDYDVAGNGDDVDGNGDDADVVVAGNGGGGGIDDDDVDPGPQGIVGSDGGDSSSDSSDAGSDSGDSGDSGDDASDSTSE